MKLKKIYTLVWVVGLVVASSCTPEQDVAPVDPISDNPMVTVTPAGDYANVSEGDVLTFEISLDKPMQYPLTFGIALADGSTADEDDFVTEGATIAAFATSATVKIQVAPDGDPEDAETLSFKFAPDFHWDWQVNTANIREPVVAAVADRTFSLDWSAGAYDGADLCESGVDLDLVILNDDQTQGSYDGATGACPVEYSTYGLPDDSYNIYVQYYGSDIPALENVEIPYVVSFKSGTVTLEGTFSSDDPAKTTHYVGRIVISDGTYTVYDENDAEVGQF